MNNKSYLSRFDGLTGRKLLRRARVKARSVLIGIFELRVNKGEIADSNDYRSDERKRKRTNKERYVFTKIKKVSKTPDRGDTERKEQETNDEIREMMKEMLKQNNKNANEMIELKAMLENIVEEFKNEAGQGNDAKRQQKRT